MKGLITTASKLASLAEVLPQAPSLEFLVVVGPGEAPGGLPVHRFEEFSARTLPADWRETTIEKELSIIFYPPRLTRKPQRLSPHHAPPCRLTPISLPSHRPTA